MRWSSRAGPIAQPARPSAHAQQPSLFGVAAVLIRTACWLSPGRLQGKPSQTRGIAPMPQGPTVRNDERTRRWPVGLGSKRAGHCLARNERWRCPAASWIDQRVAVRETWPVSPGRARAAGGQARALPHQYSTDGWRSRLEPGRSADGCDEPPLTLWPRAHQACTNGSGPCLICASFIMLRRGR